MATARDNDFILKLKGVSAFSFKITNHSITGGQPWDGITKFSSDSDGNNTMTIKAGRKGSDDVATWFNNKVGSGHAIGCNTSSHTTPSKLNFAFTGTLSFEYEDKSYSCPDVVIGQGHSSSSRNNWWLGGKNMVGIMDAGSHGNAVAPSNVNGDLFGYLYFYATSGDVYEMTMAARSSV